MDVSSALAGCRRASSNRASATGCKSLPTAASAVYLAGAEMDTPHRSPSRPAALLLLQSVGPGLQAARRLQPRAVLPGDAVREGTARGDAAVRAGQAVAPVLGDDGPHGGQFGHLVPERGRVVAGQRPAGTGAARLGLCSRGRHRAARRVPARPWGGRVVRRTACRTGPSAGALDGRRVGRRGLGRVGGVEAELGFEFGDAGVESGVLVEEPTEECDDLGGRAARTSGGSAGGSIAEEKVMR